MQTNCRAQWSKASRQQAGKQSRAGQDRKDNSERLLLFVSTDNAAVMTRDIQTMGERVWIARKEWGKQSCSQQAGRAKPAGRAGQDRKDNSERLSLFVSTDTLEIYTDNGREAIMPQGREG